MITLPTEEEMDAIDRVAKRLGRVPGLVEASAIDQELVMRGAVRLRDAFLRVTAEGLQWQHRAEEAEGRLAEYEEQEQRRGRMSMGLGPKRED